MNIKKALSVLLTLTGICQADVETFSYDFTTLTQLPDGWISGCVNADKTFTPAFNSTNGLYGTGSNWARSYVQTDVNLSSQENFTITFTLWNTEKTDADYSNQFYLSASDGYSIYIGNSHSNRAELNITDSFVLGGTFKPGDRNNPEPTLHYNSDNVLTINNGTTQNYTLTFQNNTLSVIVEDAMGKTWSPEPITFDKEHTFTIFGFSANSKAGDTGVHNVKLIPEPATATLSLLALAGLAARRRRK